MPNEEIKTLIFASRSLYIQGQSLFELALEFADIF